MLLNPTKTRFSTIFLMVERLFKLRPIIEQIVIDLDWITFVNSLHGNHCQKSLTKARIVRTNIKRDEFWDTCVNFIHMVELVLMSLKAFDRKQPCMGRVWLIMKTLEWHVLSLRDPWFKLPSNLVNLIENWFYQRWKMLMTNLHYAMALLNPYLLGEVCLHGDANAKEALKRVLWKIACIPIACTLVLRNFVDFVKSQGPFYDTPPIKDLDLLPHEWWNLIRASGHTFAPVARYILEQVCFVSSCKQNWNSYLFVHSKMRNRWTSNWVEDLVYIYTNIKLL